MELLELGFCFRNPCLQLARYFLLLFKRKDKSLMELLIRRFWSLHLKTKTIIHLKTKITFNNGRGRGRKRFTQGRGNQTVKQCTFCNRMGNNVIKWEIMLGNFISPASIFRMQLRYLLDNFIWC